MNLLDDIGNSDGALIAFSELRLDHSTGAYHLNLDGAAGGCFVPGTDGDQQ